jgi:Amt family ammonium transporter
MLDAFIGLFYAFFITLAILFGLKAFRSIFKRKWALVFINEIRNREWRLEATLYMFRGRLYTYTASPYKVLALLG